jgi:uncharacterized membrane protein (DUF441 family)
LALVEIIGGAPGGQYLGVDPHCAGSLISGTVVALALAAFGVPAG